MKSNFDFIAPVYDRLARMVFGKSIVDSQLCFLEEVPNNSSVLILGGGTGWLLEELIERKSSCSYCYVEASKKMMQKTHLRKLNDKTTLILGTEENIPGQTFDIVITNFYLDLFPEEKLGDIIRRITQQTNSASLWIATDFIDSGKLWQRAMLKIMYFFFRKVAGIEATDLPSWERKMLQHQWEVRRSATYYCGFIKSQVFKRGNVI